jgi:hypothetical protein
MEGGGCFSYIGAVNRTTKKNKKIKYNEGLRWPPFDYFHATTNQKHVGVTEGGWDRPHDRARTLILGESDGNDEGNKDDNDKLARTATSPTMTTNMLAAAKRQKKHKNQPKTCRLNGGERRYEAQPAGDAVGMQVDCFRLIESG